MKTRASVLCILVMSSLFLGACARTGVISVWKNEDFAGPPLQSLMVLAQTGSRHNRAAWEQIIAERYRRSKVIAVPAVSVFPLKSPAGIDKVLAYTREKGIEGLLVIRHVDTLTQERYHPPEVQYYSPGPYHYPYWKWYNKGYSGSYRDRDHFSFLFNPLFLFSGPYYYHGGYYYDGEVIVTPEYTSYHSIVFVESYLYESRTGNQVWSMTTRTADPLSVNHLIADISRSTFRSLRKSGLIILSP